MGRLCNDQPDKIMQKTLGGDGNDLLDEVGEAPADLLIERRLDLILGNFLECRNHREEHFILDSSLDNSGCVPGQLRRDQLEDGLLPVEIFSLLMCSGLLETLV